MKKLVSLIVADFDVNFPEHHQSTRDLPNGKYFLTHLYETPERFTLNFRSQVKMPFHCDLRITKTEYLNNLSIKYLDYFWLFLKLL